MTTTDNGSPPKDSTSSALAVGLLGIDAARRVGWAKAFDRARRIEDLEAQVAALQEDVALLRKAYVRLFGFAANLPGARTDAFDAEIALHRQAVESFFKVGAYKDGRREAHRHQHIVEEWDEVDHLRRRAGYEARREADAELAAEASRLGHDSRFDIASDGQSYRVSCACGIHETVSTEKAVWGWIFQHRVDVVWDGDRAAFRRQRKRRSEAAKRATREALVEPEKGEEIIVARSP